MTQKNRTPRRSSVIDADTGCGAGQVAAHPHDLGSQANETVDGLDATTESLRYAAEDMPLWWLVIGTSSKRECVHVCRQRVRGASPTAHGQMR